MRHVGFGRHVAAFVGEVQSNGIRMVGKDGKVLGTGGRGIPSRGTSWRTDATLNPFKLAAGTAPVKDDDVVIDKVSSKTSGLGVGDQITILVPDPTVFNITGVVTFGKEDSRLGGTDALFTLRSAQNLLGFRDHRRRVRHLQHLLHCGSATNPRNGTPSGTGCSAQTGTRIELD